MIGSSVKVLKDMSHHIGNELDEQSVWVNDFFTFTYLVHDMSLHIGNDLMS